MRLFRGFAIAAVVVAVAAGCNGDDTAAAPPDSSPSRSESASASPSPSTAPPPTPPPMPRGGITQQAAVDFAYYFIDTVNHAMSTGDTRAMDDASWPKCVGCTGVINHIRELYAAGGSAEGGAWRPRWYSAIEGAGADTWTVAVTVKQRAQTLKRTRDARPEHVDPDRYTAIVEVTERRGDLGIGRFEVQL